MNWYKAAIEYDRFADANGGLSSLPHEWQRELVALMFVNREINNGAYLQFLGNHGREMSVVASRVLRAIGAPRMADLVDCCMALVDEHAPDDVTAAGDWHLLMPGTFVATDGTVREQVSPLPESVITRIYELSYEFMDYPEDVGDLAEAHYRPLIREDMTS